MAAAERPTAHPRAPPPPTTPPPHTSSPQHGVAEFFTARTCLADGTPLYYSPLESSLSRTPPAIVRGGFLCDEMGLGKTITSIALCLTNPPPVAPEPLPDLAPGTVVRGGTLVVCCVSLVGQWQSEFGKALVADEDGEIPLDMHQYHGPRREKRPLHLGKRDVAVTTYSIVGREYVKHGGASALLLLRLVLSRLYYPPARHCYYCDYHCYYQLTSRNSPRLSQVRRGRQGGRGLHRQEVVDVPGHVPPARDEQEEAVGAVPAGQLRGGQVGREPGRAARGRRRRRRPHADEQVQPVP